MSRGSQIAIGIVSALLGVAVLASGFVMRAYDQETGPNPNALFALSGIAFCISIACFFRRSRRVTLRLIGLVLLAGGVAAIIGMNSEPTGYDSVGSLFFAASLAAGGLWLSVTGQYPRWGAYGKHLAAIERDNANRQGIDPANKG
jgi:hypothetical protein